jgi:glycosyltransferase involved in cell wall biosynthesis
MRVTIVNQHFYEARGGSELQCMFIADGLADRGHELCYVAPRVYPLQDRNLENVPAPQKYEIHWIDASGSYRLTAAILESRPDIVYWRFNKNHFFLVAKALAKAGIPLVFAASHINDLVAWSAKPRQGQLRVYRELRERLRDGLAHRGFRYVKALTVNNPEHLKLSPVSSPILILNGMTDQAADFKWPRPYCVWVSNIKPAKRPEAALAISRVLSDRGIDLLMIGKLIPGTYPDFEDPARLPSNVFYLGQRSFEEVNGIFKNALLHIHTCLPEGFSNVFLQAWLQGVPSVSLSVDPGGVLKTQSAGLCANDDMEYFAQCISRLLDSQNLRERYGSMGRAYAASQHGINALVLSVEEVLRSARLMPDKARESNKL